MPANTKYTKILIAGLALLSIYAFGVGLRWTIVERLNDYYGGMIFIRESAFYYHFAEELDDKGAVPEIDYKAQHPDGFDVERDHTFAKGKMTAYMHRLPILRNIPFERFAKRFDPVFFCLGIIPLFFLVRLIAGNNWIALLSAAIYAAAMPALPRSTGAGFDMETFSIPLLITHFCLFIYGIKKSRFLLSLLSGFALGMAIAGWDFCQFYILIFSCFIFLAVFLFQDWHYLLRHFTVALPGIIIPGLISGYLRSHYFLASYGMLLAYPLACTGIILFQKEIKRLYIAPAVVIAFIILAVLSNAFFDYSETYSHVGQKFISKIRHLNVKPADPGKLSFSERIEWTPPFNSATEKWGGTYPFIQMLRYAIPAMLPLAFSLAGFIKGRRRMEDALIFWNALVFAALYLLFVRLEVLLIVFLIFTFGIAWRHFRELGKITRAVMMPVWAAFLGCLMLFEIILATPPGSKIVKFIPESRDRMAALKGLVEAVKNGTEPESAVLADFNVSPVILAYANRGIVLHPKFESVKMRERVQKYYEALFSTSEENLNRFCNEFGADYYVFTYYVWRTEKEEEDWIYSAKYIANATERDFMPYGFRYLVADDSRVAYFRPIPQWTVSVYSNKYKMDIPYYKIFEVVSDYDKQKAFECLARGEMYVVNESYGEAEMELSAAIKLFPGLPSKAYTQLGMAYKQLGNDEKGKKYMTMGATFSKEGRQ